MDARVDSLRILQKKLAVDLEDGLQQPHVCTLVQTDLVLPYVYDQNLARRQSEQGTLALEVLILASLAAVCTFHVHNEDVLGQLDSTARGGAFLVLGHPYSLCGLSPFTLAHDTEVGAEEIVQQGGLSGGLGAEDGNEVVVEARLGDLCFDEVIIENGAVWYVV